MVKEYTNARHFRYVTTESLKHTKTGFVPVQMKVVASGQPTMILKVAASLPNIAILQQLIMELRLFTSVQISQRGQMGVIQVVKKAKMVKQLHALNSLLTSTTSLAPVNTL